jgi:hypothetical protein
VAKVRERLAESEQITYIFHLSRLNLKKLNVADVKEQYHVEITSRFTALENLNAEVYIKSLGNYQRKCKNFSQSEPRLF